MAGKESVHREYPHSLPGCQLSHRETLRWRSIIEVAEDIREERGLPHLPLAELMSDLYPSRRSETIEICARHIDGAGGVAYSTQTPLTPEERKARQAQITRILSIVSR